jgi:hypothetical protein
MRAAISSATPVYQVRSALDYSLWIKVFRGHVTLIKLFVRNRWRTDVFAK